MFCIQKWPYEIKCSCRFSESIRATNAVLLTQVVPNQTWGVHSTVYDFYIVTSNIPIALPLELLSPSAENKIFPSYVYWNKYDNYWCSVSLIRPLTRPLASIARNQTSSYVLWFNLWWIWGLAWLWKKLKTNGKKLFKCLINWIQNTDKGLKQNNICSL